MSFSMQTTGVPRCVMGSVAASSDYSAVAQLGFELTDMGGGVTPTKRRRGYRALWKNLSFEPGEGGARCAGRGEEHRCFAAAFRRQQHALVRPDQRLGRFHPVGELEHGLLGQ
jgi:hypothetical protein